MLRVIGGLVLILLGIVLGGCSIYWTRIVFILGTELAEGLFAWALGLALATLSIWGGVRLMLAPAPGDPPR